jgi:hypothetical protein
MDTFEKNVYKVYMFTSPVDFILPWTDNATTSIGVHIWEVDYFVSPCLGLHSRLHSR